MEAVAEVVDTPSPDPEAVALVAEQLPTRNMMVVAAADTTDLEALPLTLREVEETEEEVVEAIAAAPVAAEEAEVPDRV